MAKRRRNPEPGTTTRRGYGTQHQAIRKKWKPIVEAGRAHCWRCGNWIAPGQPWDLGHDDNDRSIYRGPECRACNRGAAAVKGNKTRARHRPRLVL